MLAIGYPKNAHGNPPEKLLRGLRCSQLVQFLFGKFVTLIGSLCEPLRGRGIIRPRALSRTSLLPKSLAIAKSFDRVLDDFSRVRVKIIIMAVAKSIGLVATVTPAKAH
jgi:hypothetical protein